MTRYIHACIALMLMVAPAPAVAQSIGFAEAIDRLAAACSKDIQKHCKGVNLGGGRMMLCLDRNTTGVSAQCKAAGTAVTALLTTRADARRRIPTVCDLDVRRLCAGVQPGDGNLMECFYKAKANISAPCRQAVSEAGYE